MIAPGALDTDRLQLLAPEADALHGATLALDGGARRGLF
jgi:hypothetical protein